MSDAEQFSCWLCGGAAEIDTRYSAVPLARCSACGFHFNPRASTESAHEIYDDSYFAEYPGGADYESDPGQRAFEANLRIDWVKQYAQAGRLLEVGAANGAFLEAADAAGFDVLGVEPAAGIARAASERTGLEIRAGFIESVELPEEPFDVICSWHVLEHLTEPKAALRRLREHATAGAVLLLEIPNINGVRPRKLGDQWFHLDPANHVAFYSAANLAELMRQTGWSLVDTYTVNDLAYRNTRNRLEPAAVAKWARDVALTKSLSQFSPHPTRHELMRAYARAAQTEPTR